VVDGFLDLWENRIKTCITPVRCACELHTDIMAGFFLGPQSVTRTTCKVHVMSHALITSAEYFKAALNTLLPMAKFSVGAPQPVAKSSKQNRGLTNDFVLAMGAYRRKVDQRRKEFAAEIGPIKGKREIEAQERAASRQRHQQQWDLYLNQLKANLADPASAYNADRPRCRPTVVYKKTEAQRQSAALYFQKQKDLERRQRLRYVTVLRASLEAEPLVTRETLDVCIQRALSKSVSYDEQAEVMVRKAKNSKARLYSPHVDKLTLKILRS